MITVERAEQNAPLDLTIERDGVGGLTGLSPTVALRDALSSTRYLDWADSTFKTSAWTTKYASMTEVERGHYRKTWDPSAISLVPGDMLIAEYHVDNGAGVIGDDADQILIVGRQPDLAPPQVTLDPGTTTAAFFFDTGRSSQLPTVALRKLTTGGYLDFADNTFKTSGWTTKYLALGESERGHYYATWSPATLTGLGQIATGDYLVEEYYVDDGDGLTGIGSRVLFIDPNASTALAYAAGPIVNTILGPQGLTISDLAGPAYVQLDASLMAAKTQRDAIASAVADISNVTTFACALPTLERPESGTTAYKLRVNLSDVNGDPVDADASIAVTAENHAGTDRSSNLGGSGTMTHLALGRYEITYSVSSTHALEELIFTFSYQRSAVPQVKDRTGTVIDSNVVGFTATDRSALNDVLADTAAMQPLVSANLDATISSRATPGAAMALTTAERTSTAAAIDAQLSSTHGSGTWDTIGVVDVASIAAAVWDESAAAHVTAGTMGELENRLDASVASRADPGAAMTLTATERTNTAAAVDAQLSLTHGSGSWGASGDVEAAVDLLRKALTNRLEESSGNPGTLVLYDDDGITPLKTWQLLDETGSAVQSATGSPARRSAAT